jgi:hypothetical protein
LGAVTVTEVACLRSNTEPIGSASIVDGNSSYQTLTKTSCVRGRSSNQLNYAPRIPTTDDFHVLRRPSRTCTALLVTAQRK